MDGTTFRELEEQDRNYLQKGLYPNTTANKEAAHSNKAENHIWWAVCWRKFAPKTMKRNKISSSGQLDETEMAVHGRKIPLDYIQQQINNDQDQFRRISSDVEYENLSEEMIRLRFERLNMEVPCENSLQVLKK